MKIGTRTEGTRPYVLGQPETVSILLRVLEVELLVQFEVQLSAHTRVLFIEGIANLRRDYFRDGL